MCAVPNIAVFCSSLIFIIIIIIIIIMVLLCCLLSQAISPRYFSCTNGDFHRSGFNFQTAIFSVLCATFQVYYYYVPCMWQTRKEDKILVRKAKHQPSCKLVLLKFVRAYINSLSQKQVHPPNYVTLDKHQSAVTCISPVSTRYHFRCFIIRITNTTCSQIRGKDFKVQPKILQNPPGL
jgi:hypothetical protein